MNHMSQIASSGATSLQNEFEGRRLLVASAAIGLATSMNAVMFYGLGSLMRPLQADFGWERSDISFAVTLMTICIFVFGPVVGRLSDRFGAAAVGSMSLLAYGLATIAMATTVDTLWGFWLAYCAIAVLGLGSTPIVLVRPITRGFDRRRGLALGMALTGAGIVGFWVPNVVAAVTAAMGWRAAFCALAVTAIVAAPLVWFGFRRHEQPSRVAASHVAPPVGLSIREAARTRPFWLASALAASMALGIGGMVFHLVSIFQDLGAEPTTAARYASLIGFSSVAGRLIIGLSLDRFPAGRVGVAVFALGSVGIAMLWFGGLAYAPAAVILIGLLLGAEVDLLAYMASRLFEPQSFGRIYGWLYGVYAVAFGFSPPVVGRLREGFGSYETPVLVSISLLAVASVIAFMVGRQSEKRPVSIGAEVN